MMAKILSAFYAGSIAITVNTAALAAADFIQLTTARGGLLRLIAIMSGGWFKPPAGPLFQTAFHVAVGLLMAYFYAFVLEPYLRGPAWLRGLIYAAAVWILNASVVLPVLGEGFGGSRYLSPLGMIWFAGSHTLFFVLLAVLYAWHRERRATT